MATIRPFKVQVPQSKLDDLKQRLTNANLPDEIEGTEWEDGPPLADMRRLIASWRALDWRNIETRLNESNNQFTTDVEIDGFGKLQLHFVHQPSPNPKAIPLLFVHGWPGNFTEASKLMALLKKGDDEWLQSANKKDQEHPSFQLVAPSLPNFGFSDGAKTRGFGLKQYATACHELMQQLGYAQYATQAGDWGFWITRAMGHLFPDNVRASHYNMVFAAQPKWTSHPMLALQHLVSPYSAAEKDGIARTKWFRSESQGYNRLQSSKPQTLGFGLADSPVALLAWIYEKLHDWSDSYPWSDDEVLLWVSIYWFSAAGPAAPQRIYYEVSHEEDPKFSYWSMLEATSKRVKIGLTYNPNELEIFPRTWGRTLGNVVLERENPRGGHFYSHEHPEWLLRDLREMFGTGGGAYKAIDDRSGY